MQEARGRILVVEDDPDTREIYRTLLEHDGWEVEEATAGDQALRLATSNPPAVAVIDISIPGVDGWETTRRLKGEQATRGVAVIAVTGHALDEDRRRARDVGCDAYLVKPVSLQELLAEVQRLAFRAGDG
jgi:two-component system, cell cycle response regulator DivK